MVSLKDSTMLVGFCAGLGSTFPSDISVEVPKYKYVIVETIQTQHCVEEVQLVNI